MFVCADVRSIIAPPSLQPVWAGLRAEGPGAKNLKREFAVSVPVAVPVSVAVALAKIACSYPILAIYLLHHARVLARSLTALFFQPHIQ